MRRRWQRAAAVATVLVLSMGGGVAYAGEPTDSIDPGQQGSLVDVGNAIAAAESDANLKNDGAPLSADLNVDGCSAAMLKPATEADLTSPTGVAITSRFSFQCLLAAGGTSTFAIEYSTLDGWKPLVRYTAVVSGEGGISGRPLSGACRAGTWRYRGRATGTVNFVTASTTVTCLRLSEPFFIDPA